MANYREVSLSCGLVALVDIEDHDEVVAAGPWHVRPNGRTVYAQRRILRADGVGTTQQMHRFLTGWPHVDHRNHNGLDNRRRNLRAATQAENNRNTRPRLGTSIFKGVSWNTRSRCWVAQIRLGTTRSLGYFQAEEDAARAYDFAAWNAWGEFAWLNFAEVLPVPPSPRPSPYPLAHCRRGHEFTPENTLVRRKGRACRACQLAANRRHEAKKKLAPDAPQETSR